MWLEMNEHLKDKCLLNISYNSSKNPSNFFLNELSAELSNAYSLTDNLLLFSDYNIDQFNKKKRKNYLKTLHLFRHITQQICTLPLASAKPINRLSLLYDKKSDCRSFLQLIEGNHSIIIYQSNLEMIGRRENR